LINLSNINVTVNKGFLTLGEALIIEKLEQLKDAGFSQNAVLDACINLTKEVDGYLVGINLYQDGHTETELVFHFGDGVVTVPARIDGGLCHS